MFTQKCIQYIWSISTLCKHPIPIPTTPTQANGDREQLLSEEKNQVSQTLRMTGATVKHVHSWAHPLMQNLQEPGLAEKKVKDNVDLKARSLTAFRHLRSSAP